jgi:hypothetical protein
MEERSNLIVLAGIVTGALIWVLYFEFGDGLFDTRYTNESSWGSALFSSDCGVVSGSCTAEAELKVDGCGEATLGKRADAALAFPMRMPGCLKVDSVLSQRCPKGCTIDSRTMVIIPQKLETSMDPTPDEFGECRAKASRVMSVRANCVK